MAITGKDAIFSFDGTSYTTSDCLNDWELQDSINEVVYQCSGYDKGAAGTRSVMFNISLALAADDTTKLAALYPGATGTFEAHPGGDSVDNIEITATDALIVSAPQSAPTNGIYTLDLSIRLQDVTIGAAS